MKLELTIEGEDKVLRRVNLIGEKAKNLRPALRKIGEAFYEWEGRVFEREGAVQPSGRWKPLSAAYAAWKARRYPGRKILEREGKLKASLTGPNAEFSVYRLGDDFLSIGTTRPGASAHQKGGRVPSRKVINLNRETQARFVKIISDHVMEE